MNNGKAVVLAVDDNPANLGLLFDVLDEAGFEVLVSQSGESALKRAETTQPDVLLLDVMMPGIDGFETCRQLKAQESTRQIPIIFMTAVTGTTDKVKGFELGAVDYITKPIQPKEVLARIHTHLKIQSLQAELSQKNRELRRALEQEQELNRLKSQFVSMVSHEFKTPLTTITLSCNLLQRYGERMNEENRQEELGVIERTVDYMHELLENVLSLSRWEAGKITIHVEPLNVAEWGQRLTARFQATCEKTHTVIWSYRGEIDQALLDQKILEHVFANLLSNAIKYSPSGGTVEFVCTEEPDTLRFRVTDQGIGIPETDQQHLFESFHRGANVENIKGTGLGLSIVKQFIELHGGTIAVESRVQHGTIVTVTFPKQLP